MMDGFCFLDNDRVTHQRCSFRPDCRWLPRSAYVPDLPGRVATGDTIFAVEGGIREAIRFHIEGSRADGVEVPEPTSLAEYIET